LDQKELHEREPHARGVAGLFVPQTGIVDFAEVAEAYADRIRELGGEVRTQVRVSGIAADGSGLRLETTAGPLSARYLVNCAGLQSDRVARMSGMEPPVRIIPFRGEYYVLREERRDWVKNLIYPVPDPQFPFLGVHFTRMIDGGVEAGPNAVLALKREGYGRTSFSLRDTLALVGYAGFWRMAARYWRTGLGEVRRSFSKRAFVHALRALMPELTTDDVAPGGAGVRAQAVAPDGSLVDDFRIIESERMIHVLNAPSPAATASQSIGEEIAKKAGAKWED
jgi:L-2-hydroxyglutarate oxidase